MMIRKIKNITAIFGAAALVIILLTGCAGSKKIGQREDDVHGARAYHHFLSGDMQRAIEVYKTGYAAARRIDNIAAAARYLSNIGRAFYELGQIDSATFYAAKAHEEFNMIDNKNEASKTAAFLALCFASAGNGAQTNRWWGTAVSSIVPDKKNKGQEHYYALMRGVIDFKLTSNINNEDAVNNAYAFYKKQKNHAALTTTYLLLAELEFSRGNCIGATQHLHNALSSIDYSREKYKRSRTLLTLSKICFCAGNEKHGRHYYERAVDCAPKGIPIPSIDDISSCSGELGCR